MLAAQAAGARVDLLARHDRQREAGARFGAGEITDGYDVVIEAAGTSSALADAVNRCKPGGTISLSIDDIHAELITKIRAAAKAKIAFDPVDDVSGLPIPSGKNTAVEIAGIDVNQLKWRKCSAVYIGYPNGLAEPASIGTGISPGPAEALAVRFKAVCGH